MKEDQLTLVKIIQCQEAFGCSIEYASLGEQKVINKIQELLNVFEPAGFMVSYMGHGLWLEIPVGSDMYSTEDTAWIYVSVLQYHDQSALQLNNRDDIEINVISSFDDNPTSPQISSLLSSVYKHIKKTMPVILDNIDQYNRHVEESLPMRQRMGIIPRRELYRIAPCQRCQPCNTDKSLETLRASIQNEEIYSELGAGTVVETYPEKFIEPLQWLEFSTYCRFYRIAFEIYETWLYEEPFLTDKTIDSELSDIEYYYTSKRIKKTKTNNYDKITSKKKCDIERRMLKGDDIGYSDIVFRPDVTIVPGKYVFMLLCKDARQAFLAMDIAVALMEAKCPLIIENAEKIEAMLKETDDVRLTADITNNSNLNDDVVSSFSLPYEHELKKGLTTLSSSQFKDIIKHAIWKPIETLVIERTIPLGDELYSLLTYQVKEPLKVSEILLRLEEEANVYYSIERMDDGYWSCVIAELCSNGIIAGCNKVFTSSSAAIEFALRDYYKAGRLQ